MTVYIGMNNYSMYDPAVCDGNFCPRDCEHCPTADVIISTLSKMEEEEEE